MPIKGVRVKYIRKKSRVEIKIAFLIITDSVNPIRIPSYRKAIKPVIGISKIQ